MYVYKRLGSADSSLFFVLKFLLLQYLVWKINPSNNYQNVLNLSLRLNLKFFKINHSKPVTLQNLLIMNLLINKTFCG